MPVTFTTTLPAPTDFSVTARTDTSLSLSWTDNSGNEDDYIIHWRISGGSWNVDYVGANTSSHQLTGLQQGTTYEIYVEVVTEDASSDGSTLNTDTYLNETRATSSYATTISTAIRRGIAVSAGVSSNTTPVTTAASRLIAVGREISSHSSSKNSSVVRGGLNNSPRAVSSYSKSSSSSVPGVLISLHPSVDSHSASNTTVSARGSVSYEGRETESHSSNVSSSSIRVISVLAETESHSKTIGSFTYNERTSLELLDKKVTWNENEAVWYTDWFQESRILGREDKLAIRSIVVDDAKEPCARVVVQYNDSGGESVDEESDPIELGRNQEVHSVTGIPISETGKYRLKIMEYSGYNSLYEIDTAIIN